VAGDVKLLVEVIVALVLVSAFLHALWNALLRLERDKDRALVAAVGVATLIAIALAGIRWGLGETPFPNAASAVWALIAGVLEWAYFASLAKALARGALGPMYTISRGGAIVLVWPLSVIAYGESVVLTSVVGSAIVLGGLVLSSTGASSSRRTDRSALAWAIACAASIAGYHLAYKAALRCDGNPSAVFALALALASAINVARLGREGRRVAAALVRTRTWRVVMMGAICGGSFLILMEALARGGSGYVLTLRNTSVLFATGLAVVIGERPMRAHVVGAALVAAGAVVMAWQA